MSKINNEKFDAQNLEHLNKILTYKQEIKARRTKN